MRFGKHISFLFRTCSRRGLTLVEVLIAAAIAGLLLSAVLTSFMMILRLSEESEVRLNAGDNARSTLETLSNDIKPAIGRTPTLFVGTDQALDYGDGIDQDGDDEVDEEQPDGQDDDGDWAATDDRHAVVTSGTLLLPERDHYFGAADYGDAQVDEDVKFHLDQIFFRIQPPPGAGYQYEDVLYRVEEDFEQEENAWALVRLSTQTINATEFLAEPARPVAFDVLSFNCLYWDSNASVQSQDWQTEWNSDDLTTQTFMAPASVLIELTVYADQRPKEIYVPGEPVQTVTMRTVVNLESVILDAAFRRDSQVNP
ncbi:type II secretion system protein [bacterium]|nr:type II secretion system protein [bacterium]